MYIAPGVTAEKWQGLRLDDPNSADWSEAVEILKSRIRERFIEPIDYLIASEASRPATQRRFGFTILAVDCLLVETLGAFIDGLESTEGKSKATFCKFLTTRRKFAECFRTDALAEEFYKDFRCGILHQAEVGGNSKVWSVGPLLQVDSGKIIVNRTEFHERLNAEFQSYLDELRDPKNSTLRENFRKKMDFISRR
jgi:hypothetical protein